MTTKHKGAGVKQSNRFGIGFLKKFNWLEPALFGVMLLVFIACAGYFATHLRRSIIPDEPGYFYLSTLFATSWRLPEITDYSLALGLSKFDRLPYMYFWLNGRYLNLLSLVLPDVTEWQQLVFLRIINVIYSIFTVYFTHLMAKEFIQKVWWRLLVTFLMTSTLMFVFLSGGVSYDNLANLCAAAGILFLVRALKGRRIITNSLLWIFAIGLGIMAKKTILPLALVTFIIWLIYIIKNRGLVNLKSELNWKFAIITFFVLVIFGVNASVYGVNLVKYLEPIPDCTDLLLQEQCDLSVYVRRAKEMGFPEEKLTLRDVIEQQKTNPINYIDEYWITRMLKTIYGIMGHKSYFPPLIATFFHLLYLFVFILAIKYWQKREYAFYALVAITLSYILAIMISSYNEELMSDFRHVAVQGRYLFPVLGSFYVLVSHSISQITNKWISKVTLAYTLLLFTLGGPVMFLLVFARTNAVGWFY